MTELDKYTTIHLEVVNEQDITPYQQDKPTPAHIEVENTRDAIAYKVESITKGKINPKHTALVVDVAVAAVAAVNAYDLNKIISLPPCMDLEGETEVPAWRLVVSLDLNEFVNKDWS